jgi:hypothetical protein
MTKEQQHFAIGAAIVGAAILYLMLRPAPQAALAGGAAPPLPAGFGVTPAATSTAGAAIPGTDINLGGSPAYLTYNYPAMLNGLYSNPPWGVATAPESESDEGGPTPAGACCGACAGQQSPQWTSGGIVANYWPIMPSQVNNLASVGLNSEGAAPTGF